MTIAKGSWRTEENRLVCRWFEKEEGEGCWYNPPGSRTLWRTFIKQMSQQPFLISEDSAHLAENGTFQTAYVSSPQFDLIFIQFIHLHVIDALPKSPHLTNCRYPVK